MDRWWEDASNYQLEITIPAWLVVIIPLGELFFFSSALTVLEDNFSKSGSPALIALMMNEDRHISGSRCRRLATPPPPRFMSAWCVRVRTYIAHTLPQGHCRHDEDHSTKKQMKVYKFSKYVFFFRRPSQQRWGDSSSLSQERTEGDISFFEYIDHCE